MKPFIANLRQTILQLAVEGKLVPQDPSDQPVGELLKRIEIEQQNLIERGGIRKGKLPQNKPAIKVLFKLPHKWEWVHIRQITHDLGQEIPKATFKYVDITAINELGEITARDIRPENAPSRARKKMQSGIVLFSTNRPYLKNIALFEFENGDSHIASTAFEILAPYSGVNVKYLYWAVRSDFFVQQAVTKSTGTTYPAINSKAFSMLVLPLPPLAEQKRIATKIDELMQLCDELEAKSDDYLTTLSKLRQTILQLAVEGKLVPQDPYDEPASKLLEKIEAGKQKLILGAKIRKPKSLSPVSKTEEPFKIPDSWEWVRLGHLGQITGGGTPRTDKSANFADNDIPWLTPADLSNQKGVFISRGRRDISEKGLLSSSARILPEGSVLFTSRAPIGYVAIAANDISTNQGFKSIIPYDIHTNHYIYYYLKKEARSIDAKAPGTTFREISGAKLAIEPVPLPPLAEQKRIVAKIEGLMQLCNQLEAQMAPATY